MERIIDCIQWNEKGKKLILLVAGIFILGVIFCTVFKLNRLDHKASAARDNGTSTIQYDRDSQFHILEIVPYKGLGEVGYLIGGEEPIDLNRVLVEKDIEAQGEIDSLFAGLIKKDKYYDTKMQLEDSEDASNYQLGVNVISGKDGYENEMIEEDGYYEVVKMGTGLYYQTDIQYETPDDKSSGIKSARYAPVYDYDREKGNLIWVATGETSEQLTNHNASELGDRIYFNKHKRQLRYFYRSKYVNQELFKKKILRLPNNLVKSFKVDVVTVTPEEINNNLHLIREADFITISPIMHNISYVKLYEKYGKNLDSSELTYAKYLASGGAYASSTFFNFYEKYTKFNASMGQYENKISNDITWDVAKEIFDVVKEYGTAVYIDCNVYSDYHSYWAHNVREPYRNSSSDGTSNNMAKLYMMLMQYDVETFSNKFLSETDGVVGKVDHTGKVITDKITGCTVKTGVFNGPNGREDTKYYWNQFTFLPEWPEGYDSNRYQQICKDAGIRDTWVSTQPNIISVEKSVFSNTGGDSFTLTKLLGNEYCFPEVIDYVKERDEVSNVSKVTGCDAIEYIIMFRFKRGVFYKDKIRVLELQPCWDEVLTKDQIKQWSNQKFKEEDITIDTMTMQEFIGKDIDLEENYDLIYMGLSLKQRNVSNGKTIHNDSTYNGKIYVHTGDKVWAEPNLGGLLGRDYVGNTRSGMLKDIDQYYVKGTDGSYEQSGAGLYRYSGNDITRLKLKELKAYIDDGYPVIFEDDFYTGTGSNLQVNTNRIDTSTNIYQLLSRYKPRDNENLALVSQMNAKVFQGMLNLQCIQLEMDTIPTKYEYTENSDGSLRNIQYLNMKSDGSYELNATFRIHDIEELRGVNTYDIQVSVDKNGDGVFENEEKETDCVITKGGSRVYQTNGHYELEAEISYKITCKLQQKMSGIIPYQIQVWQVGQKDISSSYVGYSAIKPTTQKVKRILQITRKEDPTLNLEIASKDPTHLLYPYLTNLDEYTFDIVTITVEDFLSLYETDRAVFDSYWEGKELKLSKLGYYPNIKDVNQYVKFNGTIASSRLIQFDLLILGFAEEELYPDIALVDAWKDITMCYDLGKNLLITHDTTTGVNVEKSRYKAKDSTGTVRSLGDANGYFHNLFLRDLAGMDRYGITLDVLLNQYGDWYSQEDKLVMRENIRKKDKAYCISTNQTENIYDETQGYTYAALNRNALDDSQMSLASKGMVSSQYYNFAGVSKDNSIMTKNISKVNTGIITEYPYHVDDNMMIAKTHAPYYQTEFERDANNDDKSDLTVWFCLSDANASAHTGVYSKSPNDVRNNYYLYTLGHVTYSGIGHNTSLTKEEAKLFVNTLVFSCHDDLSAPNIEVENSIVIGDKYYLFMDTMVEDTFTEETDTYDVVFKVHCSGCSSVNTIVRLIGGSQYPIYGIDGAVVTGEIQCDQPYTIKVEKSLVQDCNSVEFEIYADTTKREIILMRRNLFRME